MSKLFVMKCHEPFETYMCMMCIMEHRYGDYVTYNHGLYVGCFVYPDEWEFSSLAKEVTLDEAQSLTEYGKYNGLYIECADHNYIKDCIGTELRRLTTPTEARV